MTLPSREELKDYVEICKTIVVDPEPTGKRTEAGYIKFSVQTNALETLINLAQAYLSAEGLPEEKDLDRCPPQEEISAMGFNDCLSQARLVVMKLKAEIAELKDEIDHINLPFSDCSDPNCQYHGVMALDSYNKLKAEIAEKDKLLEEHRQQYADKCLEVIALAQAKQIPSVEAIAKTICADLGLCATWEQGIRIAKEITALLAGKKGEKT